MFQWFRTNRQLQKKLSSAMEVLALQDKVITALQVALTEANDKVQFNFDNGRETIAYLLMCAGGQVFISNDTIETVRGAKYDIDSVQSDNGVMLEMVPIEDSEEEAEDEEQTCIHTMEGNEA